MLAMEWCWVQWSFIIEMLCSKGSKPMEKKDKAH